MFKTTSATVSGGICGHMWMPNVMAGTTFSVQLRGLWGIMDRFTEPASFEDALSMYLTEKGGDFQDAQFTADSCIRVERVAYDGHGRSRVHVRELELSKLVPDLVNAEFYTGDFCGDES